MRRNILLASLLATTLAIATAPAMAADKDTKDSTADAPESVSAELANLPANLDGEIQRAEGLRTDGKLTDAAHAFAQLVLAAPDDARVVGEYGKTLVEEGRSEDAAAFLERAIEINPNEWSYFSALGVAYDGLGKLKDAQLAYKHALMLKPGDASVLNNMALSRMLSGDYTGAHAMILQARAADGSDEKIARNVELVESRMPQQKAVSSIEPVKPVVAAVAHVRLPARAPQHENSTAAAASLPVPVLRTEPSVTVSNEPAPMPTTLASREPANVPAAAGAPRVLSNIVMQPVPADPLAGPASSGRSVRHIHRAARLTPAQHAPVATPAQAVASEGTGKKPAVPALRMSADAS